jgi:anti-sigma B factor antagonist
MLSAHDPPITRYCTIDEQWTGRTAVLSVSGVLDMLSAGDLDVAITGALAERPDALIVDITDVNFLGCHGMNALVAAHYRAGVGVRFRVVAAGKTTRPLTLTGIDDFVAVRPTLDGALGDLVA